MNNAFVFLSILVLLQFIPIDSQEENVGNDDSYKSCE
jgi:hypothetical protein